MATDPKSGDGGKSNTRLAVASAVLSAVSALGVAYLSFQSKSIETESNNQKIAFERNKFDSEQNNRKEETLKTLIPLIVSKDEQQAKAGTATLLVLFSNESKNILDKINSALNEEQKKALQPSLQRADQLQQQPDKWCIIVGGDKDLEEAKYEVGRAQKAGFPAALYLKGGWYRTVVGPFPSEPDAVSSNIAVRAKLRNDAYVVNLDSWCAARSDKGDFNQCAGG